MIAFLLLLVPLAIAYGATWPWIWSSWWFRESYYNHGAPVVLLGVILAWQRREALGTLEARVDRRGWLLLGPGLCAHLVGGALSIDSLSAFSLALAVPGVVLLSQGPLRFRRLLPILGLIPFAIPMPLVVTGRLVFELKEVAVSTGLSIANLCGVGAVRSSADVFIPGQESRLVVADACSGLRSLVALSTLGYCLAFFIGPQSGARRWLLFAVSGPIAVLTNAFRIAGLCALARLFGIAFVKDGGGHEIANAAAWVVDIVLLLVLDAWLSRRARR